MNKPVVTIYKEPESSEQMPRGATVSVGLLTEIHAGWRNERPVINQKKCVHCLRCFILCPDGVIDVGTASLTIDYQFCKGCGICAYECGVRAISMVKEAE
jgi:pyruvate ferredoxin oxidoreductase delta subunit